MLLLTVFICLSYVLLAIGLVHHKVSRPLVQAHGQQQGRQGRAIKQQQQQHAQPKQTHNDIPHIDVMRLRPKSDANTIAKMKAIEAQRQDLYIKLLKKRGQVLALPGGGEKVVSYPSAPLTMPNVLKYRPVSQWTQREKIWANL